MRKYAVLLLLFASPLLFADQTADQLLESAIAAGTKRNFADANVTLTKLLQLELTPEMRLSALMVRGGARDASGDRIGALVDFGDAIKLQPGNPRCYYHRAQSLRRGGRDDEAERDYLKVVELDPKSVDALMRLGELKSDRREYGAAITYFTRAIEQAPGESLSYTRRATARANGGDPAGAIADMDAVIALHPADATLHHYRGVLKFHPHTSDASKAALVDFDKAIELNPNRAAFYVDRANCRSMLGDSEGAAEDVAKYNELSRSPKK